MTRIGLALAMLLAAHQSVWAQAEDLEVDAELVLAVDVSRSMSRRELEIQRRGYAEALASEAVVNAIRGGLIGRIAIRYMEWSNTGQQRVIVDWTLIDGAEAAQNVAVRLTAKFDDALRRTSISDAIDSASRSFRDNGFISNRRIIDISGDGPNNSGRPVLEARQAALDAGIVINGLPLMTNEGLGTDFRLNDLDEYYRQCVTGGPASFVIPVESWEQFPDAVRRKLVLELAGRTPDDPPVIKANFTGAQPGGGYDCMIGEKIWNRFMRRYPMFNLQP